MARSSYYRSPHWRALREFVMRRDGGRCWVLGCTARARVVDHIVARDPFADGPTVRDVPENLRSACLSHDSQVKERSDGQRRQGGKPVVRGCDSAGRSLDPGHAWRKQG